MNVPENCVARRTRRQCQKAEEELIKTAKILKNEKSKGNCNVERSSKDDINEASSTEIEFVGGNSKDDSNEDYSSDIEILGEKYVLPQQIRQSTKSRTDDENEEGTYKHIGAPSWSSLVSTSSEDVFSCGDGDDVVLLGEESDNIYCKNVEIKNHNQGKTVMTGYDSLFSTGSSSGEDYDCGSDKRETRGDGDQNQGTIVESGDDRISILESSNDGESDDESGSNVSESDDDLRYCREGNLEGFADKHDGNTSSLKRNHDGYNSKLKNKDLSLTKKRKAENVHQESRKEGMWIDGTKRDDEERKCQQERLQPREGSESVKTKLDSGKPSGPIRHFDSDAMMSDDADISDHVQRGSRKSNIPEKYKRKNLQSKDIMKILSDSIWEEGDALKEKFPPKERACDNSWLPLKFRFEDEDSTPLEKDEEQKELEKLFADLEMGWTEDDIGTTKLSKEDNDDYDAAKVTDPAESCRLGHHNLILDEEIGLICKYCRIVQHEMKHILPDLKMPSRGRCEWFDYRDETSLHYEFQFRDSTSGDSHAFTDIEGPVLNLIPEYLRIQMFLHQLEGFQFLWKNIADATMIDDLKASLPKGGSGCIISHAPGTGKTFLTIVFLLTFMEVHPTCRPVIMAPLPMLHAWNDELKRWKVNIPFHNLNDAELSGKENVMAASIIQQVGSSRLDRKQDRDYKRMVKLYSWTKEKSILGIGYNLFEKLSGEHRKGHNAEKIRKILLELPGILILDEGHTPRNQNSLLFKALKKVETGRRIILSGTPFQNNFDELYNTFCLVNPKFAESISVETSGSDAKRKSDPAKGRWASLTSLIDKNADDAVEKLRAMMDPFVHVHKGDILQHSLPGRRDTLIVLKPTDMQEQLLPKIPDNMFEKVHLVSLLSVHPSLVAQHKEFSHHKGILEDLEMRPKAGVKTEFVIEMVRLSNARDEKVLIFSEYLDPLNFLMKQLNSYFSWQEGRQVLYMHGKLDDKQRQLAIKSFNDHKNDSRVLLASIKACSEGINLVGGSRVILLDVVWNPSVERQAISRAYRLGQKKFVYVYHLILSGTLEIEKYQRQAKKDRISELVFSSPYDHNGRSKISESVLGDSLLDAMINHKNLCHIFEILPQEKEFNEIENFTFVSSANSK